MGGYKGLKRTVCVFFVLSVCFSFLFCFVLRGKGVCWLSYGGGWGNGGFLLVLVVGV
jgi:hypothetical protein